MNKRAIAVYVVLLFTAFVAAASPQLRADLEERHQSRIALKAARAIHFTPLDAQPLAGCTPIPITPPTTINGFINSSSCYDPIINGYEDIYSLYLVAGQTVTIDYKSYAFSTFMWMDEGPLSDVISWLFEGVSHERIIFTAPATKAYKLECETLYGPGDNKPYSGAYTLTVSTSGGGGGSSCTANSTTMCLNSDRFAVSATYSSGSQSGNAQATKLTSDSGYFTFFSASNIEVVIKVLNGCGVNSRFWVYAGGLTNVNTVITIRDTKTGSIKTYVNPPNTPFQPIQDSSALATCP